MKTTGLLHWRRHPCSRCRRGCTMSYCGRLTPRARTGAATWNSSARCSRAADARRHVRPRGGAAAAALFGTPRGLNVCRRDVGRAVRPRHRSVGRRRPRLPPPAAAVESAASSSDDSDDSDASDDDEGGADNPPSSASSSPCTPPSSARWCRTREYYTARAAEYRSAHGVPAYLDWVLRVLDTEAAVASLLPTAASRRCVHRGAQLAPRRPPRGDRGRGRAAPPRRRPAALRQLYERLRCLPDGVSHIESVLRRHILSTADALGAVEEARGDGGEAALGVRRRRPRGARPLEALIHEVFDEDDGPDGGRGGALSATARHRRRRRRRWRRRGGAGRARARGAVHAPRRSAPLVSQAGVGAAPVDGGGGDDLPGERRGDTRRQRLAARSAPLLQRRRGERGRSRTSSHRRASRLPAPPRAGHALAAALLRCDASTTPSPRLRRFRRSAERRRIGGRVRLDPNWSPQRSSGASLHLSLFEAGGGEAAPVAARASFEAEERRVRAGRRRPNPKGGGSDDASRPRRRPRRSTQRTLPRRSLGTLDYLLDKEYIARSDENTYVA